MDGRQEWQLTLARDLVAAQLAEARRGIVTAPLRERAFWGCAVKPNHPVPMQCPPVAAPWPPSSVEASDWLRLGCVGAARSR